MTWFRKAGGGKGEGKDTVVKGQRRKKGKPACSVKQ